EERSRIAREMHDVVAHSLSVVVVQSDGAGYALRMASDSDDPAVLRAALAGASTTLDTIGLTARDSLAETRRLVGVLRQGDEAEYAPAAGVDSLDDLLAPLRAAGREVEVVVSGVIRPLPPAPDLAVYRVVQESLTNVIKHAGDSATTTVTLDYRDEALVVTVRDDGAGVGMPLSAQGFGLVGMRERVAAVQGAVWAGPAPGGGFVVEATIPYQDVPTGSDEEAS
ncbi:MAG: sensor histidine kinase, partial [Mobilicoccus sp.]|nr:sensor histidine kinase [Mobilicoccus sp.]